MPEGNKSRVLGDGGELNSKHETTVADALRDLSIALARLANTLDEASPN